MSFEYLPANEYAAVIRQPGAIAVDVRNTDYGEIGHVRGAMHISIDDILNQDSDALRRVKDYESIILFCRRSRDRAHRSARIFARAFPDKKIMLVIGGIMAIKEHFPSLVKE